MKGKGSGTYIICQLNVIGGNWGPIDAIEGKSMEVKKTHKGLCLYLDYL